MALDRHRVGINREQGLETIEEALKASFWHRFTMVNTDNERDVSVEGKELIRIVESGPKVLELKDVVRFESQAEFEDFLLALTTNNTIQSVYCHGKISFGISLEQWSQMIRAFGGIHSLEHLEFIKHQVPNVFSLEALTHAVTAENLRQLVLADGVVVYGTSDDVDAFQQALRRASQLEEFEWFARLRIRPGGAADASLDTVLLALCECPRVKSVSVNSQTHSRPPIADDTWTTLVSDSASLRHLTIQTNLSNEWLVVSEALPNCHLESLTFLSYQVNLDDGLALWNAMENNSTITHLSLSANQGFCDTFGLVMGDVLRTSPTVRRVDIRTSLSPIDNFSESTFKKLLAVLHYNHDLVLQLPYRNDLETLSTEIVTVNRLNECGLSRLVECNAERAEWVDVLGKVSRGEDEVQDLSCRLKLILMNPLLCR